MLQALYRHGTFFIREDGRTRPADAAAMAHRFGAPFTQSVIWAGTWLEFDPDPRADLADYPILTEIDAARDAVLSGDTDRAIGCLAQAVADLRDPRRACPEPVLRPITRPVRKLDPSAIDAPAA